MKFLLHCSLLPLLILLGLQSATAQSCSLPAPTSVWVNETTPTSIELEWTAVTGAVNYEVTTVENGTGFVISTEVVPGLIHTVQNLLPDTEYTFTVKPICSNDTTGMGIPLVAQTGIIVVDVIAQLNCPVDSGQMVTYNPGQFVDRHFTPTRIIRVDGEMTNANNATFELAFADYFYFPYGRAVSLVGIPFAYRNSITTAPTANGKGEEIYYTPQNGGQIHLMTVDISSGNNGKVGITWHDDVKAKFTYCETLALVSEDENPGEGGDKPSKGGRSDIDDLQITPNPGLTFVRITTVTSTPIEVFDINGKVWRSEQLPGNTDFQLDLSTWPAGTYFLRYQDKQGLQVKRFIKL